MNGVLGTWGLRHPRSYTLRQSVDRRDEEIAASRKKEGWKRA